MDKSKMVELLRETLNSLSPEQQEKLKNCSSPKEAMKILVEDGKELPDELLDAMAGGNTDGTEKCPKCGSTNVVYLCFDADGVMYCNSCGYDW